MTTTTYTFHLAYDHSIVATAQPGTLQEVASKLYEVVPNASQTTRLYVHNGLGVVAAVLVRHCITHDILRDDYRKFDAEARAKREAANIANH